MKLAQISRLGMWLIAVTVGIWPIHLQAQERLMTTLESGPVSFFAVSPDSKTLASVNYGDNTIRLWNTKTGKETRKLQCHVAGSLTIGIFSVAFSPDGKTLAAGSVHVSFSSSKNAEGCIKFWDTKTWKEIRTLKGHGSMVHSVVFSPDGKTLASGSQDKAIILWGVKNGKKIRTFKGHNEGVRSIEFSPDGKTLVSCGTDETILWDVRTGKEKWSQKGFHPCAVFSPDGKTLALADIALTLQSTIHLFDTKTREEKGALKGHNGLIRSVGFSPDGKTLVSCSQDPLSKIGTIKLWDTNKRKEMRTLNINNEPFLSVVFSPNGKTLISCSGNEHPFIQNPEGMLRLWNVNEMKLFH